MAVLRHGEPAGDRGARHAGRPPGEDSGVARRSVRRRAGTGGRFSGAFVMGAMSGLVAAPCSAPVMAAVLTWVTTTKSAWLGFAYLFAFSLGMCALLVAVGVSSGALSRLAARGHLDGSNQEGVRVRDARSRGILPDQNGSTDHMRSQEPSAISHRLQPAPRWLDWLRSPRFAFAPMLSVPGSPFPVPVLQRTGDRTAGRVRRRQRPPSSRRWTGSRSTSASTSARRPCSSSSGRRGVRTVQAARAHDGRGGEEVREQGEVHRRRGVGESDAASA